MATFTLIGDIDEIPGADSHRVTTVWIRPTFPIADPTTHVSYENETRVKVTNGEFTLTLPADAVPGGYEFVITAPQLGMRWSVPQQAASSTVYLSTFTDASTLVEPFVTGADVDAIMALIAADNSTIAAFAASRDRIFNVKSYGAVGNGSTDDTTSIQSAATAAVAAGGTLFFPPGTYMLNPGVTNASGTSINLINFTGPLDVVISRKATVKVSSSTIEFACMFGATTTSVDMSGTSFSGGGTLDCNSASRIAAHVVPDTTHPNVGIGNIRGHDVTVTNLRFTNFDSIWCVALSSSAAGNMSNVEVSHCQFDNLGTTTAADKHDFSAIYLDAIGMKVHNNQFWAGAPGAQTFTRNYGARTAIELHGSGQSCHDNTSWGLQWGGNLWVSYNSWLDTDSTGSKNSTGIAWHDNNFNHCAVGINLGGANNGGTNYGLVGVRVHHNNITVDPTMWNADTGGGIYASGILVATSAQTGSWNGISIDHNDIRITPNNTAMNSFTWAVSPQATEAGICFLLLSSNTAIVKELNISHNTIRGAGQDGIRVTAYSHESVTIANNKITDPHMVTGGTGYAIFFTTNGTTAGTNNMNNCLVANNDLVDDQGATYSPYGYTTQTSSGVVYCNAGSASNTRILDNGYHCASIATLPVVQGFASSPAPLVRATDHAATFTAPSGNWCAGSRITTMTQRNALSPVAGSWVQTDTAAGGSGSTWIADLYGTGTPEAAVTAPIGSTFRRTNGGAGTTLYQKESGSGNTGWVAR